MGQSVGYSFAFMMKLLLLLSLADSLWAQSPDECAFTADCRDAPCASIADVACVCNFGKCVTTGNPFYQGKECREYRDCKCKDNPPNCFCRDGLCDTTGWECHQDQDCKRCPSARARSVSARTIFVPGSVTPHP